MNAEYINEQLNQLQHQMEEMCVHLDETRDERNDLLRQRFDLKEQRRYFRKQLREAVDTGNIDRADHLEARLDEIAEELDELDDRISSIEDSIEEIEDDMEELRDSMAEIQQDLDNAEGSDGHSASVTLDFDSLERAMDSLNRGLQRVLGKVADTLENVDFDNLGHNVQSAASKAAKTVSNAAQDAAREVENVYHGMKENRAKPGGIGDYRISGSSVLDGGCYNRISASGACKVSSDLVCRELKASGSFRACGNVDCSGEVRTSGSLTCDGNMLCGSFTGSGAARIAGDLKTGMLNAPGSLSVGGGITATEMRVTGSLKVGGDCEADGFTASGLLNVGGMINSDVVNIQLSKAESKVRSIGGSQVTVAQTPTAGFLSSILMKPTVGTLICESIEGDTLDLTGVRADTVRGTNVVIRSGCRIDRVEYSETCSIDGDAIVASCQKV